MIDRLAIADSFLAPPADAFWSRGATRVFAAGGDDALSAGREFGSNAPASDHVERSCRKTPSANKIGP